ncbi:ArsR/SmtB family transcription factor [Streptomyces fructofermentans]|uniref:ArsR/SmtB family transcription factor n=1 Tax=Streptomyces fructofermentans TaxID=152141 RepID=UPI0033E49497
MVDRTASSARDDATLPRVLAALSDPTRIGIVRTLADGAEHGWGSLRVPVAKSTLSHHMKVLREAGLTRVRGEGTRCYVTLRIDEMEERFPGLLPSLLAAAAAEGVGTHVGMAAEG